MPLPLPVFSAPLSPIISTPLFSPLFGLGVQGIPFLSAVEVGLSPQRVFLPTQPHRAHYQS